jgi:hypothetical protein
MDPRNYSRLAAIDHRALAIAARAFGLGSHADGMPIALFVSGMACFLAAAMAWLGFGASRK